MLKEVTRGLYGFDIHEYFFFLMNPVETSFIYVFYFFTLIIFSFILLENDGNGDNNNDN